MVPSVEGGHCIAHTHDGIFCWRCRHDLVSVPCTAIILAKSKDTHDFIIECIPGYLLGTLILKIVPVQVLELMVCAMLVCFIIMRYRSGASSHRLPESSAIGIASAVPMPAPAAICSVACSLCSMSFPMWDASPILSAALRPCAAAALAF